MKPGADDVLVIDAVRTPLALSAGGGFGQQRAEALSALVIDALLKRNPAVEPESVDELFWGCANQSGEQGGNLARNALLLTRLPQQVPAITLNRLCASSMSALHLGAQMILSGCGETCIVGGVEHQGHRPMEGLDLDPRLSLKTTRAAMRLEASAQLLAKAHRISRDAQDRYAQRSHQRAAEAQRQGDWDDQLIPVPGVDSQGAPCLIRGDEAVRPGMTLETLGRFAPLPGLCEGTVTAGNGAAVTDGASALLLVSAARARLLGLEPLARVKGMSVTGCDPAAMGLGSVTAMEKLLDATGLKLTELDLIELNEVFAAQVLAVLKELFLLDQLDERINLQGGAIALGDPPGCSGTRLCTTLLHQMRQRQARLGLATQCVRMGQGVATLFERPD